MASTPVRAAGAATAGDAADVSAAATGYVALDRNGNGWRDAWAYDGRGEYYWLDGDENGRFEVVLEDRTADGRFDQVWGDPGRDSHHEIIVQMGCYGFGGNARAQTVWYDGGQNRTWDMGYFDSQSNGFYEWVMVDNNRDGTADTWTANSVPRGRTVVDTVARHVATSVR